ncbi:MAG: cytochrome bc complex cytochrome b subunit [Kineosporiaceae bacterium]|nr:cytochrome bc complex cytochrome b subunit [Kineosporiaceae bacterium]MBK8077115.1 cytochrome bc complex cytochrome b subunit [Kineosporiaceae bacterium]
MTTTTTETKSGKLANWADERLSASKGVKFLARKIFPDHWSFMLGEVALYSFIILLLTGVFLSLFYIPSSGHTTYQGVYAPLVNQHVSEAFASTVRISFDVRGGLLMRQIHHWAALVFVAAMTVHMFRVFFTGAFRKPRELNWVIGCVLVLLGIVEGFLGYSLPDDLLSGTGIRIASSIILAIPVVGSYLSFFLFGGEFPGEEFIPRIYTVHVLLLPAIFLALIGAHLVMLVIQKHTQYPGPGRTNKNVVGYPLFPVYTAKAGGFFFIVFGVITLMSALVTINPIWAYGTYDPSPVSAGSQPDWYMGFMDGAVRLMTGWGEFTAFGFTWSFNILVPALVIPGLMTAPMFLYPWIEQWATGDKREHHLLDRPRNAPTRTGLGAMAITFYILLWISGGNDIMATVLRLSINDITNTLRVLVFVLPPVVFIVVKRICLGLQRKDRDLVLHGRETAVLVRTEAGEFFEVHEPLDEFKRWKLVQHETSRPLGELPAEDERGVRRPGSGSGWKNKLSKFYFEQRVEPVTPMELAAAHHDHHDHEAIESTPAQH